jgi:hypothetical protein
MWPLQPKAVQTTVNTPSLNKVFVIRADEANNRQRYYDSQDAAAFEQGVDVPRLRIEFQPRDPSSTAVPTVAPRIPSITEVVDLSATSIHSYSVDYIDWHYNLRTYLR